VRHTRLWSCAHVHVPWIRAEGAYREMLLQSFSPKLVATPLRLAGERGSHRSESEWGPSECENTTPQPVDRFGSEGSAKFGIS
jgi:hypothetical protein